MAVLLGGIAGCSGGGNDSGQVAAARIGQVSATPLARVAFDRDLVAGCGDGAVAPAGASTLARHPYLQQVTGGSAQLVWTSTATEPMTVRVTRPDGEEVLSAASSLQTTRYLAGVHQHRVELTGLEPGTTYCWELRDGDAEVVARTGFRTGPAAGSGAPVSFVAFGDSGSGSADQASVAEQLRTVPFDLMLVTGDVAYGDGTLEQLESWYFGEYEDVLRSIPSFPVPGNHDYHTDGAGPYLEVFSLPENGGPDGLERWYSYDWGDVHFVALDTERVGPAQAEWLERDLSENELPWTIVYAHKGPYSSGEHGSNLAFRDAFGPILARHHVPLVLSGHDHDYERTVPIDGTVYVVTGGGGKGTRPVGSSELTAFSEAVLHFVWVRVDGSTLDLRAIDATGQEFDSLTIVR